MNPTLSWSLWMAWKEAQWRPLWLSGLGLMFALLVGFSSHSLRPAAWVELAGDIRVLLVLVLLITTMGLPVIAHRDTASVVGRFATDGEWFDATTIRFWLRLRAAAVTIEAVLVSVAGTLFAAAVNVTGSPPAIDWFFSGVFTFVAGGLVLGSLLRQQARITVSNERG